LSEGREKDSTLSLEPVADASIGIRIPNYGGLPYLEVFSQLVDSQISGSEPDMIAAYLMFDLSDLPPGAKVLSATLRVFQLEAGGDSTYGPAEVTCDICYLATWYEPEIDWAEYGITRDKVSVPSSEYSPTDQVKIRELGEVAYTFDITKDVRRSLVREQLAVSEVLDFTFRPMPGAAGLRLASREYEVADRRPRLTIEYTSARKLNKVSLVQNGTALLTIVTTSIEVKVSVATPLREYFVELVEESDRGWAKIIIDKSALFANPYVQGYRARFYENPSHYILVVEYGMFETQLVVESHKIGTFDAEGRPKRIFELGDEVYVKGMNLEPGRPVVVYLLPDGAPLTCPCLSNLAIAKATVTVGADGNIQPTMIWTASEQGTYDLWVDVNIDRVFGYYDPFNDEQPEAYPMITVPEFNEITPLLLAALAFVSMCCYRPQSVKKQSVHAS